MSAAPYSPIRLAGDLISFSGLVGRRDGRVGDGLNEQLEMIFDQLDERLAETGLSRGHIIKTTIWLTDMNAWEAMNGPYAKYFDGHELPARSAVGAQLLPGFLVELEAWAHA